MPFMNVSSSLAASTPIIYPVVAPNLDAELADTTGWVIELGDFNVRNSISTPVAHGGDWYFFGGAAAASRASYQIDLTTVASLTTGDIDAGLIEGKLNWWQASWPTAPQDFGGMGLRFRDAGLVSLGITYSPFIATSPSMTWIERELIVPVPPTARYVQIVYYSDKESGTNNDTYVDDITLVFRPI